MEIFINWIAERYISTKHSISGIIVRRITGVLNVTKPILILLVGIVET